LEGMLVALVLSFRACAYIGIGMVDVNWAGVHVA